MRPKHLNQVSYQEHQVWPPDKSQIWLDFKEFHWRLELVEFFNRDKKDSDNPSISQSIIDFMNNNATEELNDNDMEDLKNKEIQKIFKPKSGWRPSPPNKTLETFQRSVKQEILRSKPKRRKFDNLTNEERKGLKTPDTPVDPSVVH